MIAHSVTYSSEVSIIQKSHSHFQIFLVYGKPIFHNLQEIKRRNTGHLHNSLLRDLYYSI